MSSSTSTNSSARRGRGRPSNASRRAAIVARSLDAGVNMNNNSANSSSEEGVSPARPSYNSRSESITRAAAAASTAPSNTSPTLPAPPAFARAAAAVATRSSSPVPLPPALFSGTFEVPSATPHTSPPPNRVTSPLRGAGGGGAAATSPPRVTYLTPPQHQLTVANNPPSVTVSDAEYHQSQRVATTVKIDPPSTSGSWFNSTPVNVNGNVQNLHYQNQQNQQNQTQYPPLPQYASSSSLYQQQQQNQNYQQQNAYGTSVVGFVGRTPPLPPSSIPYNNNTNYQQQPPPLPPYHHHNQSFYQNTSYHQQEQQHQHQHQQPPVSQQQIYNNTQRNMPPIATANSPSTARLINAPSRSPPKSRLAPPPPVYPIANPIASNNNNNTNATSSYFRTPAFTPQRPSATFREASALRQQQAAASGNNNRQQSVTTTTKFSYDSMTPEQQAETRKKLFDKFLILQRSFPAWNIPIPSEESSLDKMFDLYESYVKQITIHSNSTQYKIFLVIMFVGIEFAASRFAIDLSGYAEMQIRSMHRYEGVLLELGEKYMGEGGGEWPVEARIVLLAVIQAGVFFVAKYVEKWTGSKGMSKMVHSIMDNMMENVPAALAGGSGEPVRTVDAHGFPMAPGTESAIHAVDEDDDVSAAIAAAASATSGGGGLTAPTVDLGNMLSGLFGGGGGGGAAAPLASAAASLLGAAAGGSGGNGGGGLDVANLVGTAMKFIGSTTPSFDSPGILNKTSPSARTSPSTASSKPLPTSPTMTTSATAAATTVASKTSPTVASKAYPTSPGATSIKLSPSRVPRKAPVFTE